MKLVTITTGWNCAAMLPAMVTSIRGQILPPSAKPLHFFVDDGSPDATYEALRRETARPGADGRPLDVRLIRKAHNTGACHARFLALHARGADGRRLVGPDDVCVLLSFDGDRLAGPFALARIWEAHLRGADMTHGRYVFLEDGGSWDQGPFAPEVHRRKLYRQIKWGFGPPHTFRARLVQDIPPEVMQWSEPVPGTWYPACTELALLMPALERSENVVYIDEVLYLYRHVHPNVTRRRYRNKRAMEASIRAKEDWIGREVGPPLELDSLDGLSDEIGVGVAA